LNAILEPLRELESFSLLAGAIKNRKCPALASGVIDSQKCHLIAGLCQSLGRPALIISHSELTAKNILEDMRCFDPDARFYPSKDIFFYSADVQSADVVSKRISIIRALAVKNAKNGDPPETVRTIVLSSEALMDKLSPPGDFGANVIRVSPGDELSIDVLAEKLVFLGYERVELVEAPGHFAIRGGILDVFTTAYANALRVEFFGDEVDSVRILDTYSQRSVEKVGLAEILPMKEALERSAGASLFDYLSKDFILFFDEPNHINKHMETVYREFLEAVKNRLLKGISGDSPDMVFSHAQLLARAKSFDAVVMTSISQNIKDFAVKTQADFTVKAVRLFRGRRDVFKDDIDYWLGAGYRVLILVNSGYKAEKLRDEIVELGRSAAILEDLNAEGAEIRPGLVTIARGTLDEGFEYPLIKFAVASDKSMASDEDKRRRRRLRQKASRIESFTDLRVGDYVVHENHGIGVYRGIEQITVDYVSRDYLKLAYADGGHIYVPTDQMDLIQKYIGSDGARVKLNNLGGGEWLRAKNRAKGAVRELAKELVALYARRSAAKGFAYSKDTVWQREFEETFPFEETEDQLRAIEDVKKDMEAGKIMDRLVCGDVGYGKTEIALRAAFKAAMDGKQVAYLVPTTILAQQHFNTFTQRMKDFPVGIEMLSRFRGPKQQKESIQNLENGTSDIVIGTHRLLSKDIRFKDLGLVIVDEEQRFGVTHKEKLKTLKENVDVLTLTATPIPRTLHMSLSGIRDMSVLEEPPQERQPVQTYVLEYNQDFVREAIMRELGRGGQVYYLHNRVRNIAEEANFVSRLVPEAVVAYGHGQMPERDLENVMMDFIEGKIDVLVCTAIIESGLDIANVNTIIVQNADYMGLSQLYQLRGRVGRSSRLAYAYLMYRRDKVLQEHAEKRLQTIREFTEFGSGFKIAMRDLELRGAGNLLGAEQHGHLEAIGYDLYCKLLAEAVTLESGGTPKADFETTVDLAVNAYIPPEFIPNEAQKLEIYKKISLIQNVRDYYDVREEIEDRFGDMPGCVENLLATALFKARAHSVGVSAVKQNGSGIVLYFNPQEADADPHKIAEAASKSGGKILFTAAREPYVTYKIGDAKAEGKLVEIGEFLEGIRK